MKNLSHLVNRAFLHSKVRIITNFGNFYLNSLYDLNDFVVDASNDVFKSLVEIKIFNKNKEKSELEKRYIIISDAMLLIFIPDQSLKNLGMLIFYSSLMHIEKLINLEMDPLTEKNLSKNSQCKEKTYLRFKIAWKESDIYIGNITSYDNTLLMEFDDLANFNSKIDEKRRVLINSSELFAEDYMKFTNLDSLKSADEWKLVELALYHESRFMKAFELRSYDNCETQVLLKEQAKEIVFLYQKIVEILSVKNDQNYSVYMTKMQNFLEIAKVFLEDVKEYNFQVLDESFA